MVQPDIGSFVSVLRYHVTPFERSKTKNANCFECDVFDNGNCELSAIQLSGGGFVLSSPSLWLCFPFLYCAFHNK